MNTANESLLSCCQYKFYLAEAGCILRDNLSFTNQQDHYMQTLKINQVEKIIIQAQESYQKVINNDNNNNEDKDKDILENANKWIHQYMKQQADSVEEVSLSGNVGEYDMENVSSMNCDIYGPCIPQGNPLPNSFYSKKSRSSRGVNSVSTGGGGSGGGSSNDDGVSSFLNGGTSLQNGGPVFVLEDESSFISTGDAVMWAWVNPFSPLATGSRLFPF
mmetsp:Transcript_235/g.291  ORF Transcript_235/g.291 Transcript_235/m.291 type:complete len:218 (-) Transcript_235:125-778(-)